MTTSTIFPFLPLVNVWWNSSNAAYNVEIIDVMKIIHPRLRSYSFNALNNKYDRTKNSEIWAIFRKMKSKRVGNVDFKSGWLEK